MANRNKLVIFMEINWFTIENSPANPGRIGVISEIEKMLHQIYRPAGSILFSKAN